MCTTEVVVNQCEALSTTTTEENWCSDDHGKPCDDGNDCTTGDRIDKDCNCIGDLVPNCSDTFSDCQSDIIDKEDFENGWGIWNDGGSDCYRVSANLLQGTKAIRLRDNTGGNSSMFTNSMDLRSTTSIELTFKYSTFSFDNSNEDFLFEYSVDMGSTWTILQQWIYAIDFHNAQVYEFHGTFENLTLSSTTLFRFRADASANNDILYLDDIELKDHCTNSSNLLVDNDKAISLSRSKVSFNGNGRELEMTLHPNPASYFMVLQLNKQLKNELIIEVFNIHGTFLEKHLVSQDKSRTVNLDLSEYQSGAYILKAYTDKGGVKTQRFVVVK